MVFVTMKNYFDFYSVIVIVLLVITMLGVRGRRKTAAAAQSGKIAVASNSIVGKIKEGYESRTAVPMKYAEMDGLVRNFVVHGNEKIIRWESLVDMGDVYARGFFPYFLPNINVALDCYEVGTRCPDAKVRGNAEAKMTSIESSPMSEKDQQGRRIHVRYGESIIKLAEKYILETKKRQLLEKHQTDLEKRNNENRKKTNKDSRRRRLVGNKSTNRLNMETQRRLERIGGGSQNSHDHGITSASKSNITRLVEEFKREAKEFRPNDAVVEEAITTCKEVQSRADNSISTDTLANAHRAIVSLCPDEFYSETGVSQSQILDMVMWKISTIADTSVQNGLKETLCKRLSSGVENGNVVCGTGKVSRIISVFEGVLEGAQKGISINLVEREIAQLAAKVRHDVLVSIGPVGRKAYETGNNAKSEYASEMSKILRERVQAEYIENLNMEPSVINPLVDVYTHAY